MPDIPERRAEDHRIAQIIEDVSQLKFQMAENTLVTVEVRDMLAGIKLFATVSKWGVGIAAGAAAAWGSIKGMK